MSQNLLDEGHRAVQWQRADSRKQQAWPIRQAFTYCIDNMCRYGCILTCEEAFIFRVQPLDEEPGRLPTSFPPQRQCLSPGPRISRSPLANGSSRSPEQLQLALMTKGKIEYILIPWKNHTQGGVERAEVWTVNLALWFFHVLAGHRYEVAWTYDPKEYEELGDWLVAEPQNSNKNEDTPVSGSEESLAILVAVETEGKDCLDSDEDGSRVSDGLAKEPQTQHSKENRVTPTRKRRRNSESPESEAGDGYHLSFPKRGY